MAIPTPYSYRQYTGDGVAKDFSVPFPYLDRAHVHLFLDSRELVDGTDYSWTSGTQLKLNVAPQAAVAGTPPVPAQVLTVRRITPEDDQIVQWKDGSYIIADDLNESDKQWLYLIQEHHDALILLLNGLGTVPGGGSPGVVLAFWNKLPRNKDPNKGTATEVAQTISKLDQLLGDWPKDGKDKYIATTDAISARLDPYVQDGVPTPLGLPQKEQHGKEWFDTDDLVQRFWDADAGAWVTLANTGPQGPPGPAVSIKGVLPAGAWTPPVGAVNGDLWIAGGLITGFPGGDLQPGHGAQFNGTAWLDTGPLQGPAGTVTVGGTTTALAGSPASVTNTGTPAAAVLQFVIPQGPPGPTGPPGPNTVVGNAPITSTLTGTRYDLTFDPIPLTTLP